MTPRRWWGPAAAVLLIGAASVRYLAQRIPTALLAENTDLLFLPALFDDVAAGGSIRAWHLPSAPYFLPDWPIYAVARVLLPDVRLELLGFMAAQLLLFWWAARLLVRELRRSDPHWSDGVLALGLLLVIALPQHTTLAHALTSYAHFGTVILGLLAVTLLLRMLDVAPQQLTKTAGALAVLTFVGSVSDRWFAVWFAGPLLLVVAVEWYLDRGLARRAAVASAALVLPALLSGLVHAVVLTKDNPTFPYDSGGYVRQAGRAVEALVDEFDRFAWAMTLVLVLSVIVALAGFVFRAERHGRVLLVLPVGMWAASVTAQTLIDLPPAPRYYMASLALPLVLAESIKRPSAWPHSRLPDPRLVAAAVVAAVVVVPTLDDIGEVSFSHDIAAVQCIDDALAATGSRHGIAGYWDTKPITTRSDHHLRIATYGPQLVALPINTNTDWYGGPYDFAIVRGLIATDALDTAALTSAGPGEVAITSCGIYELWDWGPGGLGLP